MTGGSGLRTDVFNQVVAVLGQSPSIGTGSVRRIAQLTRLFPQARFAADPRQPRHAAAEARSAATTTRSSSPRRDCGASGFESRISVRLPSSACVPAPGQGIVAIEIREGDGRVAAAVQRDRRSGRRARRFAPSARSSRRWAAAVRRRSARWRRRRSRRPRAARRGRVARRQPRDLRDGAREARRGGGHRRARRRAAARRRRGRDSRRGAPFAGGGRRDSAVTRATVYLIGAGPGDPGLITVRGLQCLEAADVVLYDHLVHARLLRPARPDAEKIDVGVAAPQPLEQEAICYLLAEKGARRQDGRAAEMGRPVRLRSRRRRSAVSARARRALRGRAGHSGRHRGAELCGHAGHLSGRRRHADLRARPRGRGQGARVGRLGQPGAPRRHARLLRGPGAAADDPDVAPVARTAARGFAAVIYDGTLPTQETQLGSIEELATPDARFKRAPARDSRRRPRDGAARASALVRRAAAVRQARARHAAARTGGRAGRAARSDGRRGHRGADDSHRAARRLRTARRRVRARRHVRLDHLCQRQRGGRLHRPSARHAARSAGARRRQAVRGGTGDGRNASRATASKWT